MIVQIARQIRIRRLAFASFPRLDGCWQRLAMRRMFANDIDIVLMLEAVYRRFIEVVK